MKLSGLVVAALLCCAGVSRTAVAESVGVYGNVWEIAEPDAIDSMKSRLGKMEKDGSLRRNWESYRDRAVRGLENPEPIKGITNADSRRTWTFDPTYVYQQPVKDDKGNVLVPAGTRLNPLSYISLTKPYVFIDGRSEAQVRFAKRQVEANPRARVVLTAGSFMKLSRDWKTPVYFDQKGVLTRHFGIKRVPAVLSQRGSLLQIEEIPQ